MLTELRCRGHLTVDTDYDGWQLVNSTWDEPRMDTLLAEHPTLVVSGTAENQGRFYDRFDHVVLLSAPIQVLIARLRLRTNNPYGKSVEQQAEIARFTRTIEPLLRKGSTLELDGQRPVSELADVIEQLLMPTC